MAMFRLALLFLVTALMAGLFGFGLVADLDYPLGKYLFLFFFPLAILTFIAGARQRPLSDF
jgi:uncharacterized membrane protein YtjA (UPF0391 family)